MNKDYSETSLMDFKDFPSKDIFERASCFNNWLDYLRKEDQLFYRRISTTGSNATVEVMDRCTGKLKEMIFFASNDYLNLTKHPKTIAAGVEAVKKYGTGAGSVPLLGGTLDIHVELERKIARFKSCENAILYSSGYATNCSTLLSMLNKKDIAILDMYVHASINDGCANTNIKFFKHNDMASLERVLKQKKNYRTKLIIVDGVYSMDGDIAPLDEIVEIAKNYNAYVMVDEAHATGVIGENGRGTPEYFNLEGKVDIVAGTFSKCMGCVGGFIAAKNELVELLHYYSRGYIFSTAPTPQSVASLIAAIGVIENEPVLRERLWNNIRYFKSNLINMGFDIGGSETAIFPIIIGNDLKVRKATAMLHEAGIYVNPVQYPAVTKRLSRIRFSLMATHTKEQLDKALNVLSDVKRQLNIPTYNMMKNEGCCI